MTDLADESTDADMLAMWRSGPLRNPGEEPLEVLEGRITSMAARLAAQTREWLVLVAEFNRRRGWVQWGMRSAAHWLSWSCSVGPGAARECVREAFAAGKLSYSKVRAVTRVADRVDDATLVEQGLVHSAAQSEKVVRGYHKADRVDRPQVDRRRARPGPGRSQRWVFRRPDGTPVPQVPEPPTAENVSAETGAAYDPDTIRPDRYGEPFSLRDSVDVLCRNSRPEAPS